MKFSYRYGWPLGHLVAKAGMSTTIKVEVIKDEEAGVFVGTSPDLRGFVVEAENLQALIEEARLVISDLLYDHVEDVREMITDVRYQDRVAHA